MGLPGLRRGLCDESEVFQITAGSVWGQDRQDDGGAMQPWRGMQGPDGPGGSAMLRSGMVRTNTA